MKCLQQIKDEVAKGLGYPHWNELLHWEAHNHYLGLTLEKAIDQISLRYAQEKNTESVEILDKCEQWIGSCNQYAPILKVIEELITKHKQS